jgi:hypothetical protein
LYYYGARYYEPEVGKFYGIDPMTEKYPSIGGMVYCVGNPLRYIDPTGMEGEETGYDPDPQKLQQAAENAVNFVTQNYATEQAACNVGVAHAFQELTGSTELNGLSATKMVEKLGSSPNFSQISKEDVSDYANQGNIVVIGRKYNEDKGESRESHVALATPGQPDNGWPIVMDTGGGGKRATNQGMNWSWGAKKRDEGLKYYLYNNNNETKTTGANNGTTNFGLGKPSFFSQGKIDNPTFSERMVQRKIPIISDLFHLIQ